MRLETRPVAAPVAKVQETVVTLGELNGETIEKDKAPKGAVLEHERQIIRPEACTDGVLYSEGLY